MSVPAAPARVVRTVRVATFVAWRTIFRGHKGIFALSVLLMSAVYVQLVFVPSLIRGASETIERQLRENLTASITVTPAGDALAIPDPAGLLARARAVPGVRAATASVLAGAQVRFGGEAGSWPVLAVDPPSYAATFATPGEMIEGTFLDQGAADEIVLGVGIAGADRTSAQTYHGSLRSVHAGDQVVVTLVGGSTHTFTVRGIYETKLAEADQRAFLSAATAARLVPALAGQASAIHVRTETLGDEEAVIEQLRRQRPGVVYEPWQRLRAAVRDITGSFDVVGAILGAVSLVVAVIVVFIVTYIDLTSRRRTIGIERAIGITRGAIVLGYALRAVVFGALGVLLGQLVFAYGAVPFVRGHPFDLPIGPVTLAPDASILVRDAAILLAVGVLGAVLPAWRSVRVGLLDAIWG